eukprot:TRINITY_DN3464_c0_g1_i1.p1 TRINITY_DN3464_c0_g1~~TRINITY_DN3464_c0_g1_i1.p1  ORF type:complete len:122 (+),score=23.08 TRINITY_DN3464_c0_g1_i1:59-424(+)
MTFCSECKRNKWDQVRVVKNVCILRCRYCQLQVKMRDITRCLKFENRHCTNRACSEMHVCRKKQSLRERVARHGTGVLEKVPADQHPRTLKHPPRRVVIIGDNGDIEVQWVRNSADTDDSE